jgi:hypothetical protein
MAGNGEQKAGFLDGTILDSWDTVKIQRLTQAK